MRTRPNRQRQYRRRIAALQFGNDIDFDNAVSFVMGASAQMQDRKKAGEVLSHFDGAEMFDQMCREHEDFSERFQSLVKEYRNTKQWLPIVLAPPLPRTSGREAFVDVFISVHSRSTRRTSSLWILFEDRYNSLA